VKKISIVGGGGIRARNAHTSIRDVCRKANSSVNEAALFGCRSYTFLKMLAIVNKASKKYRILRCFSLRLEL